MTQPLDLAFFRLLSGRTNATLPKDLFPALLKITLEKLTETKSNIMSGFRKAGIFPMNKDEVLNRFPNQDRVPNKELVGSAFLNHVEEIFTDW